MVNPDCQARLLLLLLPFDALPLPYRKQHIASTFACDWDWGLGYGIRQAGTGCDRRPGLLPLSRKPAVPATELVALAPRCVAEN